MKKLIVPIRKENGLPECRVLLVEFNPETLRFVRDVYALVMEEVLRKQEKGIVTPRVVMYEAPNGYVFSCVDLALNVETLPNGDTVGNFLRRNGYCFLPEQVRIPPMDHVEVDFAIDIEEGDIYFVVHGDQYIRTLPIKLKTLE